MLKNDNKRSHGLSKMQLALYNCEKYTQPMCSTLEGRLWKLCYNHGINYYVAIRTVFIKMFLIGWENGHDKMVSEKYYVKTIHKI